MNSVFWPRSSFGVAKVFSYWETVNYRESYGLLREQWHFVQSRKSALGGHQFAFRAQVEAASGQ